MNREHIRAPGQLSWLGSALIAQRNNIADLMSRLKDFGARAGTSLAIHRKFLDLLNSVAAERDKELEILNDIEDVEKYHAELRARKLLRQARPANDDKPSLKPDPTLNEQPEEKPARSGLLKWVILFALFSQSRKNNQDQ